MELLKAYNEGAGAVDLRFVKIYFVSDILL